jgi:hypothetical protein
MPKYLAAVVLLLTCSALFAQPQTPKMNRAEPLDPQKLTARREAANAGNFNDMLERMQQAQIARTVAERQAQLRRDTEKLVALTAELKEHVNRAGTNILSVDVIKKAVEIQKLAKSVEEKMKNAY